MNIPFVLPDKSTFPANHQVAGEIVLEKSGGISIHFDGYGTADCEGGAPVHIEVWNGELRLIIFPDINEQDPVIISLANAKAELLVSETEAH